MDKKYTEMNKKTLEYIKLYPDLTERWMDEHNERIQNDMFSRGNHLPIVRLLEIYDGLNNGKHYVPKSMNKDTYYGMSLGVNTGPKEGEKIIKYTYHGSSAVGNNLDELFWLVHVIFDGQDFDEYIVLSNGDEVFPNGK